MPGRVRSPDSTRPRLRLHNAMRSSLDRANRTASGFPAMPRSMSIARASYPLVSAQQRHHPAGLFFSDERIFVESCGFEAGETPPRLMGEWIAGFEAPVRLGVRGRVSD
jgi:hypothetical protein